MKVTFGELPPTKNDIIIQNLLAFVRDNPVQYKQDLNKLLSWAKRGIKRKGFSKKNLSFANVLEMISKLPETPEIVQVKDIISGTLIQKNELED